MLGGSSATSLWSYYQNPFLFLFLLAVVGGGGGGRGEEEEEGKLSIDRKGMRNSDRRWWWAFESFVSF